MASELSYRWVDGRKAEKKGKCDNKTRVKAKHLDRRSKALT